MKGGLKQKMATRKDILDLYENDDKEREKIAKAKKETLKRYMEEEDFTETNALFVDLKVKLKKSMEELEEQEDMILNLQDGLIEKLGLKADHLFVI